MTGIIRIPKGSALGAVIDDMASDKSHAQALETGAMTHAQSMEAQEAANEAAEGEA